ncbi:MAG: hypothetical protein ACI4KH_08380 [Oscillospiraceae bacterium]
MEVLILLILIIVLCLCLGMSPLGILFGFIALLVILTALCMLFFIFNISRIIVSKKVKAKFVRVDKSPKSRFDVAYYKVGDEEYPCAFPCEPMMKSALYKEEKEINVCLDKKFNHIYDRYSVITCFTGFVFGAVIIASAIAMYIMK